MLIFFPKKHWSTLTNRITEILNGQQTFLTIDRAIENVVSDCAKQIVTNKKDDEPRSGNDYRTVNVDSLNIYNPRSIGCEHVVLEALRSLELDTLLANLGFNNTQASLAIGSIIGRACPLPVSVKRIGGCKMYLVSVNYLTMNLAR